MVIVDVFLGCFDFKWTSVGYFRSRRLVFDKPFLLYMKEKGAKNPYFAIWIENAELMSPQ